MAAKRECVTLQLKGFRCGSINHPNSSHWSSTLAVFQLWRVGSPRTFAAFPLQRLIFKTRPFPVFRWVQRITSGTSTRWTQREAPAMPQQSLLLWRQPGPLCHSLRSPAVFHGEFWKIDRMEWEVSCFFFGTVNHSESHPTKKVLD